MIDAPNFLSALAAAPSSHDAVEEPRPLTGEVRLERVIILVNPLSGGVGPQAADEAAALLAVYPLQAEVVVLELSLIHI